MLGAVALSGCATPPQNIVYKRSVGDLNTKAQQLMESGDTAGAVSRLESARDLDPKEPTTLYNLAIAYQSNQQHDKAVSTFKTLLEIPGADVAQVNRDLGVAFEDWGDTLLNQVADSKDSGPKVPPEVRQQALEKFGSALLHYQRALDAGAKDAESIKQAIENLQSHRDEVTQGQGGQS
jgi:tetratricopeptide (TPR) repeat protein